MLILNVCYILMIDILNFSSETAPVNTQDFTGDQSTFVQVMAWCRQAKIITWTNVDFALVSEWVCRRMASRGKCVYGVCDRECNNAINYRR